MHVSATMFPSLSTPLFSAFRCSYFHEVIAFSSFIFTLIYHSCAVQVLEKVTEYFLRLKNDRCRKHEFYGPTRRSIGLARVCFLRILGRFRSQVLESKCCICLSFNKGNIVQQYWIQQCWMMLQSFERAL